jgi:hypothetical protein
MEAALPRGADERCQPLRFLRHGAASEPGDREVLPSWIDLVWRRNRCDQAFIGQPP